jgi:hypothetical protein
MDASGHPLGPPSDSDSFTITFESLRNPYPSVDRSKVGYIIVKAEATLENDMPTQLPTTDQYAAYIGVMSYFLTNDLTGDLSINGVHRSDVQFVPWEGSVNLDKWGGSAGLLGGSTIKSSSLAFVSGDKGGLTLHALFWIITTPGITLQSCENYPAACINLSSDITTQKDFKIAVDLKESWKAWLGEMPNALGVNPFIDWNAYWNACTFTANSGLHSGAQTCLILLKTLTPVPIHWEAMISEFGVLTNGSLSITKSETTIYQVTISQTLTGNEWVIVRKYSFTTMTDTATVPSVGQYASCPTWLGPLCNMWNGVPYWLIALGILLVLVFLYAPAPKRGGGVVSIILGGGRGGSDEEDEFTH